ncbi:MAG TPA: DUF2339 domain-containing protein, partial [Gemmataceae bacterium]|nr:DUF2339 domain-containing protein [Gemmataceae bacterium]
IGLLIGLSLCGGGLHYHRRGWRIFGQFLTSGGIVLLYLSTFASFGYYSLLPREHAALFLIAIIAEAALLAIYYEAPAIAIMAVIGGLLTPPLMRTDHDQYQSLFTYLALLNVGVVALAWYRPWPAVSSVALAGTQLLFWAWYWQHFHPEKRVAALTFQAVVFGLFLVHSAATHIWRRRSADIEDLVRLLVNAFLFAVAFFVLVNPDYNDWRGPLALALAVVYTLLALQISIRRPDDGRQLFVTVALAMALIATAFAWQASAAWIAVGWAVQGLILWWFGLRIRADALRMLGVAFLALAAGRLVLIDTPGAHPQPFVPLLNKYGVPATAVAAALIMAAIASRRFLGGAREMDVLALRGLGLCGVGLLWFVLSFEAFEYFEAQSRELDRTANLDRRLLDDPERDRIYRQLDEQQTTLRRSAQTALSVLWAIYAVVMLTVGFRMQSRPLRWFALGLFGLTLLKVGFIDTAELRGLYRVAAFLALSLMMGLGAWGYQKVRHALVVAEHKETDHATS